jgi:hypothetical protein
LVSGTADQTFRRQRRHELNSTTPLAHNAPVHDNRSADHGTSPHDNDSLLNIRPTIRRKRPLRHHRHGRERFRTFEGESSYKARRQ